MHWKNVGGCRVYSTWWSPASCSSTSPASGWTSSRPLLNQGPFPTVTFCVCMEVRVTVYSSYWNHSEVKVSVNKSPLSYPVQEPCAPLPLNTAFAFILPADFWLWQSRVFPLQRSRLPKGVLLLFVQMILLPCYSREEGRILKQFVPIKFLSVQPSFQRALEMMDLEIK